MTIESGPTKCSTRVSRNPLELAINLSALSQLRRRRNGRLSVNACRRGSCDRGIWTKPLVFAADAGSYGFCFGFSKFIRLQSGQKMGVIEVGWSVGSDWEAVEESFCTEVRVGLRLVAVSGDTATGGVEAPAVESGISGRLGRIKDWAPYS